MIYYKHYDRSARIYVINSTFSIYQWFDFFNFRCLYKVCKVARDNNEHVLLSFLKFPCPTCRSPMRVRYILQRHACVNYAIQEYVNHWKKERNQVRLKQSIFYGLPRPILLTIRIKSKLKIHTIFPQLFMIEKNTFIWSFLEIISPLWQHCRFEKCIN